MYLIFRARNDDVLAGRLAASDVTPKVFTQTLLSASGGVWIYALSVMDQVRDGDLPADRLDALPAGLAGYYSQNLRRIRELNPNQWDEIVLPILGTLAAATDPITASTIAVWSGNLPLGPAQDVLDGPTRPFLAHVIGDRDAVDPTRLVSVAAPEPARLPDWTGHQPRGPHRGTALDALRYSMRFAHTTRQAHAKITAYITPACDETGVRQWEDADNYALAHLTEHAAAAQELDRLALNPGYLLWTPLPPLLRLRNTVTDPRARRAIAARELMGDTSVLNPCEHLH
ncbi:hypothetical protein ABZU25_31105 [Micromonospora sp. NPDC005215]|uniref:hypothetical protein n=1 Tax=Micromonospora sp. NPDC005215 TaxID=3157024 RepID=UPI0033B4DF7E